MTKNDLIEMIRKEIQSLAFETLRTSKNQKSTKPNGLTEDELEHALFYGGNKPNKDCTINTSMFIKEGFDNGLPKINASDVTEFEDSFETILQEIDGASVIFDTQSNGYSLKMWIGQDGIEAGASGTIEMGNKGKVKWAYSLQNGLTVSTEDLVVERGNKFVVEKLYSNYDAWQKDWREKLTIQPGQETTEAPIEAPMEAPVGGDEAAPVA